jgi:hypothetical protein
MPNRNLFYAVGLVAVLAMTTAGGIELTADNDSPAEQVSCRIRQLTDRVAKLEARVAELEKRPSRVIVPRHPPAPDYRLPEGSVPKEFNGFRYYIVPVDTQ